MPFTKRNAPYTFLMVVTLLMVCTLAGVVMFLVNHMEGNDRRAMLWLGFTAIVLAIKLFAVVVFTFLRHLGTPPDVQGVATLVAQHFSQLTNAQTKTLTTEIQANRGVAE